MNLKLRITICILLILAVPVSGAAAAPLSKISCDPAFVSQQKNVITVKPTGMDDTANIQCAFDAAVAAGKGKTVQLAKGTFYTRQVAVQDFFGRFVGSGVKKTVVMNISQLSITPNFWFSAPSADNLWPTLFSFVDGEVAISDLAIHITGTEPTLGWVFHDVPVMELYGAIFINGTHANASVNRILIEGEPMAEALYGYNLLNGVYYAGFIGETEPYPPMSGVFSVTNSTFHVVDSATPFSNLSDATVIINNNTYDDVWAATEGMDPQHSNIVFTNNKLTNGVVGLYLHEMFNPETSHANFLVRNNSLGGGTGIVIDNYFGDEVNCLLLNNDTHNAAELGVYLGEGTTHCLVKGSKKTTVLDLGTDNILIGVTRLPAAATMLRPQFKSQFGQ